jgi:hypothetical protein
MGDRLGLHRGIDADPLETVRPDRLAPRVAPIDLLAEPGTKAVVGFLRIGLAGPHRIRRISTAGGRLPAIYNIWWRHGIPKSQQLAAFSGPTN